MIGSRFFILQGSSRNENGVLEMESGKNHEKNCSLIAFAKVHALFDVPSQDKKFTRRYGGSDDQSIETIRLRSVNGPRINHVDDAQ